MNLELRKFYSLFQKEYLGDAIAAIALFAFLVLGGASSVENRVRRLYTSAVPDLKTAQLLAARNADSTETKLDDVDGGIIWIGDKLNKLIAVTVPPIVRAIDPLVVQPMVRAEMLALHELGQKKRLDLYSKPSFEAFGEMQLIRQGGNLNSTGSPSDGREYVPQKTNVSEAEPATGQARGVIRGKPPADVLKTLYGGTPFQEKSKGPIPPALPSLEDEEKDYDTLKPARPVPKPPTPKPLPPSLGPKPNPQDDI
jgi:hypothetical protein